MSEHPTMPELFERLTETTGDWAQRAPQPYEYELTSKRKISGTDEQDRVTVVMDDFSIASIRVDHLWASEPGRTIEEIEERITEAVNAVMRQYLIEEFSEAQNAALPMSEVHEKLRELSADFSVAYERSLADLQNRSSRS